MNRKKVGDEGEMETWINDIGNPKTPEDQAISAGIFGELGNFRLALKKMDMDGIKRFCDFYQEQVEKLQTVRVGDILDGSAVTETELANFLKKSADFLNAAKEELSSRES